MTEVEIQVTGAFAKAKVTGKITAGMVGCKVHVKLDKQWEGLSPMLVAKSNGVAMPMVISPDGWSEIPHERCVGGARLLVGIDGRSQNGAVRIPTVWADCGIVAQSPAEEALAQTTPPTPSIAEQIIAHTEKAFQAVDNASRMVEQAKQDIDASKQSIQNSITAAGTVQVERVQQEGATAVDAAKAQADRAEQAAGSIRDAAEQLNQLSESIVETNKDISVLNLYSDYTSDTLLDKFGSITKNVKMNALSTDRGYPQFDETGVFIGWGSGSAIYHTISDINVGDKITVLAKGKTTYTRFYSHMIYILDSEMKLLDSLIENNTDEIRTYEGYIKQKEASKIIVVSSTVAVDGYALRVKTLIETPKPDHFVSVSSRCDMDTNSIYGTSETRAQGDICADGKYIYTCAQRYMYKIDASCPLEPVKIASVNLTPIFSGYPNNSYGRCSGIKAYNDKIIATFRTTLSSEDTTLTQEHTLGTLAMYNKADLSLVAHIPFTDFMIGGSLTIVDDLAIVGLIKRGFRVYKIGSDGFTIIYDGTIPVSSIVNAVEWQYSSVDPVNKYLAFARYKSGIIVYKYAYNGTRFTANVLEEFDIRNFSDITADDGIHTTFDVVIKNGYLYATLALARNQIGSGGLDNRGILWGKIGSLASTYKIAKISDTAKSPAITGGDPAPIHIDMKDDAIIVNLDFNGIGFYKLEGNEPVFIKNHMIPKEGRYPVYCHFANGDRVVTSGYFNGVNNANIQIADIGYIM